MRARQGKVGQEVAVQAGGKGAGFCIEPVLFHYLYGYRRVHREVGFPFQLTCFLLAGTRKTDTEGERSVAALEL
jgi:hypothetical protein